MSGLVSEGAKIMKQTQLRRFEDVMRREQVGELAGRYGNGSETGLHDLAADRGIASGLLNLAPSLDDRRAW